MIMTRLANSIHRLIWLEPLLVPWCRTPQFTGQTAKTGRSDRHVVIVCIDGFAAYLLNDPKAPVPTIRKLAKEGAVIEGGMRVSNRRSPGQITRRW